MTWIVRVALERPYTFIVLAILILIAGPLAASRMPTDIFPNIGVPVLGVAWTYTGLSPDEMSGRILNQYERILTTTVNDIEHTESTSLPGMGIVKIYFQPNVDIRTATAQVTSVSQSILRFLPPGTTPPLILNYNASTVPILQMAMSSPTLSEQRVLDLSQNTIRPFLATVPGASIPYSYGGKVRQVVVALDPVALQAKGLSAQDVGNAIAAQSQINPVGTAKIGSRQYVVRLNDDATSVAELRDLPIKTLAGATVYIRDVAQVTDGNPPQQSIVHVNGNRAVLSTVFKNGAASTLDVVEGVKNQLSRLKDILPDDYKIDLLSDQSLFVKAAINGVVREGVIAAGLTSLMILLFLGSWRSTVIIATSIPLAVFSAVAILWATGQTLNIMTLGGLALAVGILVDDATVTIENINWHLEQGKDVRSAILDGAAQIVTPAFVSLLCICIVFLPMFSLTGVAGYLFVPMALSVMYAMIASFVLSRTLVPTLAMYLLKPHAAEGHDAGQTHMMGRWQRRFEGAFSDLREQYRNILALTMRHRRLFVAGFLGFTAVSFVLAPFLGSDFFPSVDAGQITIHARPPVGTRIENSAFLFSQFEREIRRVIPPDELASIVDNLGLPTSSINTVYSNSGLIGYQDGDIFITLKPGHRATADYVRTLRERLPRAFPETTFSFLPADIVSQILNFGTPAPIDLQILGPRRDLNEAYGVKLLHQMRRIPGVADARMQQSSSQPQLRVSMDRSRMSQLGLTARDVTASLGTSLAGSSQTAPVFWLDPKSGVSYPVVAQTPEYRLASLPALENIPITGTGASGGVQILGGLARITRENAGAVVNHYNILPVIDLYATPQDRDLGGVAHDVRALIAKTKSEVPKGSTVVLRGQVATMDTAFSGLFLGLAAAIVLIYFLIVVNFQSWLDPFVIITALPAALAGIVWMLFATHTTMSVPALTGAIMCMGVATANSILVVSFARERLEATGDAMVAAVEAGFTRFRPVLMTAFAMVIGMAPMALGLGEGGEQNAPLGRAVIGGLVFATTATLLFVPVIFSIVHGRAASRPKADAAGEAHV